MCFRPFSLDPVLRPDMHLQITDLQPETTTAGERIGLRGLLEAEKVAIEMASFRFSSLRDRYLRVMDRKYQGL
jgi:hypothetical protein